MYWNDPRLRPTITYKTSESHLFFFEEQPTFCISVYIEFLYFTIYYSYKYHNHFQLYFYNLFFLGQSNLFFYILSHFKIRQCYKTNFPYRYTNLYFSFQKCRFNSKHCPFIFVLGTPTFITQWIEIRSCKQHNLVFIFSLVLYKILENRNNIQYIALFHDHYSCFMFYIILFLYKEVSAEILRYRIKFCIIQLLCIRWIHYLIP